MAEGLLRHRIAALRIDAEVASSGRLYDGREASEHGIEVLLGRGIDIDVHRSRVTTAEMLAKADLVVGMAREHVRDAVVIERSVFPRTFTLKELVRRGERFGAREAGERLTTWAELVSEGRDARALLGSSEEDDVADPIGQAYRAYERTADELTDLVDRLTDLVWPHPAWRVVP
jgi:protein-tyrosine phosphatase